MQSSGCTSQPVTTYFCYVVISKHPCDSELRRGVKTSQRPSLRQPLCLWCSPVIRHLTPFDSLIWSSILRILPQQRYSSRADGMTCGVNHKPHVRTCSPMWNPCTMRYKGFVRFLLHRKERTRGRGIYDIKHKIRNKHWQTVAQVIIVNPELMKYDKDWGIYSCLDEKSL